MAEGSSNNFLATKRYAVVTGGNKGIGFEICKQLASRGVVVLLTARDELRGLDAVEKLRACGLSEFVVFHQLDVGNSASVAAAADFIRTKFGKLDILDSIDNFLGKVRKEGAYVDSDRAVDRARSVRATTARATARSTAELHKRGVDVKMEKRRVEPEITPSVAAEFTKFQDEEASTESEYCDDSQSVDSESSTDFGDADIEEDGDDLFWKKAEETVAVRQNVDDDLSMIQIQMTLCHTFHHSLQVLSHT